MSEANAKLTTAPDYKSELEALGSVLKALTPLSDDAKSFVFRTAAERLGISCVVSTRPANSSASGDDQVTSSQLSEITEMKPKAFLKSKRPLSELQRMVCLAYYLTHVQNKPHFKTQDL